MLAKAGVSTEPKSRDEFISAAHTILRAGFLGVACGGTSWKDAIVFDGVAWAPNHKPQQTLATRNISAVAHKTCRSRFHKRVPRGQS